MVVQHSELSSSYQHARVCEACKKQSKMVATTCAARGVVYWLGSQLYVQLTNRARGLSLVASRGPAFMMPETSGFAPLEAEPSVDTVVAAVLDAYANDERKKALGQDVGRTRRADGGATDPGVAFAGLGDPLLRWPDVAEITRRVREHHEVPISLYTNGLLPPDAPSAAEVASTLHEAGVTAATIALNAADPDSYAQRMLSPPPYAPAYHEDAASAIGDVSGASFGGACEFLAALSEAGVETTVTAVASPDASPAAVRDLGTALGAVAFKERTFLE